MKRLHEFIGDEYSLLLDFPLYNKILINTEFEIEDENEAIYGDGELIGVFTLTHFLENRDFQAMKSIFLNEEINNFHYCPFCDKSVPIVYKSSIEIPEAIRNPILSSDNINSSELHEANVNHAETVFDERYKAVRDLLFDRNGILNIELNCTAKEQHKFNIIFALDKKGYLTKIGQSPSIREFDNSSKRYKSILKGKQNKQIIRELNTSTGLKSHGIGIGSFVYLRRIFERLIYGQYDILLTENPTDNSEDFKNLRMAEKIEYLKDYLPKFLVSNKSLYSILSKGIHELSEQECLENYDTVYAAIIYILEQKLEIDEKNKREQEIQKNIQSILNKS
ncbi:hypothetical protein ACQRXC_28940 (plasmid) [Niallia taxi]|uniref:hypothetical protein n=5 Tax=Niallia TaxID=2837506 RepID=UPI0015F4CCD8|nr:hypothetical protein [Niallia taxi]MED4057207.1 hypothetical protein [Niallia taxi]